LLQSRRIAFGAASVDWSALLAPIEYQEMSNRALDEFPASRGVRADELVESLAPVRGGGPPGSLALDVTLDSDVSSAARFVAAFCDE
jgi:hypothetical protein